MPTPIRPLSLDDIVSETITVLLRRLPQFLLLAMLANLPVIFWQLLTVASPDQWVAPPRFQTITETSPLAALLAYVLNGRDNLPVFVAIAVAGLSGLMQTAGTTLYAYQLTQNHNLTLAQTLQQMLIRLPAILLGSALPTLLIVVLGQQLPKTFWGNSLFVLALLIIYPRFLFATASVMTEQATGLNALWRSLQITHANYWRVLGTWLVLELVIAMALLMPTLLIGLSSINLVLGTTQRLVNFSIGNLTIFIVESFRSIALLYLFLDIRRRQGRRRQGRRWSDGQGAVEVAIV